MTNCPKFRKPRMTARALRGIGMRQRDRNEGVPPGWGSKLLVLRAGDRLGIATLNAVPPVQKSKIGIAE